MLPQAMAIAGVAIWNGLTDRLLAPPEIVGTVSDQNQEHALHARVEHSRVFRKSIPQGYLRASHGPGCSSCG